MKFSTTKLLLTMLTLCVVFLLLKGFFFSGSTIAYVDSNKLLGGYNAMVQARTEFEKKEAAWKANIDSLTLDVQEAMKKYEKTAATGTDKEKQLSRELITTKQKQLYDYQNAIKQNASQEEQRV